MTRSCSPVVLALGILAVACPWRAWGDIFVLRQGGQVVGELQNAKQVPRENYVVKTAEGVVVTLSRTQVKQVLRPKPDEIEYEKIRPQYPDTAEGQWKLAEWCREHKLPAQRKTHLQRVIELDPNHEAAHRALGHTKIDGKWTTQTEFLAKQGLRFYKGRPRSQQEIDILEEAQKAKATDKEWRQKIGRLIGWLASDRADEARDSLLAIHDPAAAKTLALGLRNNPHPEVRILLAQALAGMNTRQTLLLVASRAIEDPVEDVRLSYLDILKKKKSPDVVGYFVGRLRDKNNVVVNRAAVALRVMRDPSAIGPLIDALVTVHKFRNPNANPGQMNAGFNNMGGIGMGAGSGPPFIFVPKRNSDVLDALVALTGQAAFEFDVPAWRRWFAAQRSRPQAPDIRRDK